MTSKPINLFKDNYYVYLTSALAILFILRVLFFPLNSNPHLDIGFLIAIFVSVYYLIKSIKTGVILSFWGTLLANGIYLLLIVSCLIGSIYTKVVNPDNLSTQLIEQKIIVWHATASVTTFVFMTLMTMVNQSLFKSIKNNRVQILREKTERISDQRFSIVFKGNHTVYKIGNYQCFDEGIMIKDKLITFGQLNDFLINLGKSFDMLEKEDITLIEMYFIN